ncbi:hypothetical protein GKO32_33045 [Amycolatopsis sp. RM579]|uniref:Uncharacterized protein n=1 Tax=Amycolatopsis pithecellobii TaxID=664692 RepID=A0A6N7ZAJ5_9PSEU|nr:hypothetical protein [Amycolatopsis pithecellobii]
MPGLAELRADYRAVLTAVNALGENQREHVERLRTLSQQQADTNTRVRTIDDRTRSIEESLAEVKDLLVRALDR